MLTKKFMEACYHLCGECKEATNIECALLGVVLTLYTIEVIQLFIVHEVWIAISMVIGILWVFIAFVYIDDIAREYKRDYVDKDDE